MSIETDDHELNRMLLEGRTLEAFERYYDDDCALQENLAPPRVGKAANRAFLEAWAASLEEVHGVKLIRSAVNADTSFGEWQYDLTFRGAPRRQTTEVAVRTWRDGKVTHERFYYDPSAG